MIPNIIKHEFDMMMSQFFNFLFILCLNLLTIKVKGINHIDTPIIINNIDTIPDLPAMGYLSSQIR